MGLHAHLMIFKLQVFFLGFTLLVSLLHIFKLTLDIIFIINVIICIPNYIDLGLFLALPWHIIILQGSGISEYYRRKE